MRSARITFIGADGHSRLAARLDRPDGEPVATALFAHCFTCTHNVRAASGIAEALLHHDIAVLRFDFTGLGASEGEFANTDFSSNVGDLIAAAAWLRSEGQAPSLLIGHSLGGAAVIAAAADIPEAAAVATIAAPAEPGDILRHLQPAIPEIEAKGEAEVLLAGRSFRIRRAFLDDVAAWKLHPAIDRLGRPLLVCHAPGDRVVGIEQAARIYAAAKQPKSFLSLDGADHLLSRRADSTWVGGVIAAWAARFIGRAAGRQAAPIAVAAEEDAVAVRTAVPPADAVLVEEAGTGAFAQRVVVRGRHVLKADEPTSLGGSDSGPSPYDYLLAGLGACTAMTMRMYAERKKLPVEHLAVTLRHDKVHAADCAECETREGRIDRIERSIEIRGPLDAAARSKLLEIAEKCPVHRTLHAEVWVTTTLKED